MSRGDKAWKRESVSKLYLEGVRAAIPLAKEQIATILALIQKAVPNVESFLDLGCGDGILGRAILSRYPKAKGLFLDFSDTMIKAAKAKNPKDAKSLFYEKCDYGKPSWVKKISGFGKFDVIVSGFSIHHQTDASKKRIYREIHSLLNPGGIFLNLEHVSSPTPWLRNLFDETFIESLFDYHKQLKPSIRREKVAEEYYNRPDKTTNILASVEVQCSWLKEIGFKQVDCFMKLFELALFGGVKP